MAKLIFENNAEEVELTDGSPISEPCEKAGVPFACGGEGICGSCVIEVVSGMENLSEFTDHEKNFFGEMGTERLACQCKIKSGTVKVKF
jgi:ferredoxin